MGCSTRGPGSGSNVDLSRPLCLYTGKLKRWSESDMVVYCVLCRTSHETTWIRIWDPDPSDPVSVSVWSAPCIVPISVTRDIDAQRTDLLNWRPRPVTLQIKRSQKFINPRNCHAKMGKIADSWGMELGLMTSQDARWLSRPFGHANFLLRTAWHMNLDSLSQAHSPNLSSPFWKSYRHPRVEVLNLAVLLSNQQ